MVDNGWLCFAEVDWREPDSTCWQWVLCCMRPSRFSGVMYDLDVKRCEPNLLPSQVLANIHQGNWLRNGDVRIIRHERLRPCLNPVRVD